MIATRAFAEEDQRWFARASGDVNPMHLDPLVARRTQAGAPVVHGVHVVLWALDALIGAGRMTDGVAVIEARFQKFVYSGADVALRIVRERGDTLRAALETDGLVAITVDVRAGGPAARSADATAGSPQGAVLPLRAAPLALDIGELAGRSGTVPPTAGNAIATTFPHAAALLGANRLRSIAQLSTLVGMYCPGLHSIFSGFRVALTAESDSRGLVFRVTAVDDRFRMVELTVDGDGISGSVTAFVRQPPQQQPRTDELRGPVAPGEFRATTALIVGGSRGLGALTARAIAAGGGRVIVTYAAGEADARDVAADIGPAACRVLRYDAREDAAAQLTGLEWNVNQVYYFATGHIFRQKSDWFVAQRFAEFCRIYVDGFAAVCTALRARGAEPLIAFYPSSVALGEHVRDMTEYRMAKAAGEMLCDDMNRLARGLRVVVARLPRVLTDQTATVMPAESSSALEVMLPIIRQMHSAQ